MSNIIRFPTKGQSAAPDVPPALMPPGRYACAWVKRALAILINIVWFASALTWPLLKWGLSLDVFFQFLRMLYYWNTPGVSAGWTFVLHFAALTALTYFVAHPPKGFFSR